MEKVRKSYAKNFVQYNIYFDKKKALYYQRYGWSLMVIFTSSVILLEGYDWMCQEARSHSAKVIILVLLIIYCITAIIIPIWYRRFKEYNEKESLVLMSVFNDVIGGIGFAYMSITALVFPVRGYKVSLILLFALCITYLANFTHKKALIERLVREDGFNTKKNNSALKRLDSFNRYLRTTPTLIALVFVSGLIFKRSTYGLVILGCIITFLPILLMDVPVCGMLQIKYAREYELQEFLPTKSRKELEIEKNVEK